MVYDRFNQHVFVCLDCQAGITVPASASRVIQLKRDKKFRRDQ